VHFKKIIQRLDSIPAKARAFQLWSGGFLYPALFRRDSPQRFNDRDFPILPPRLMILIQRYKNRALFQKTAQLSTQQKTLNLVTD